ncbi:exonuclease/endonuclease/phosphatase family protein [Corallococcus exiguus]|uniref:Endonuclease/exonuclease/phosphatase domain-containing protein n=1 Tax=Corallococcus exiguus TaxID=83462 RepID=A0A7X4Y6W5_9BACT|nr:hypothetical protein [Corallococcus exiguus]NBC39861.1 hypothetical protein [Corallococcus exiguus]TNV63336.1 hypothetical protein FH620_15495 [Corallococcus exiguus]
MPTLRVLSWNLRTFALYEESGDDLLSMAKVLQRSGADIVALQEIQIGKSVPNRIGAKLSFASHMQVARLAELLGALDRDAGWRWTLSGASKGYGRAMRDGYAYLWKQAAANGQMSIDLLSPPEILDIDCGAWSSRRPALATFLLSSGKTWLPLNVISYHARLPDGRTKSSTDEVKGVEQLARLPEVGGGVWRRDGRTLPTYWPDFAPLPTLDTIVLGDFNCKMDAPVADAAYKSLLTHYTACVSWPGTPTRAARTVTTMYGRDRDGAPEQRSAYDNIFVLNSHANGFVAKCQYSAPAPGAPPTSDAIDIIEDELQALGPHVVNADRGAWRQWVFNRVYATQKGGSGLSDHLPVWADITLQFPDATSAPRPVLTSNEDGNSLFHAVEGLSFGDSPHFTSKAAELRKQVVKELKGYEQDKRFPSSAIQQWVFAAMQLRLRDSVEAIHLGPTVDTTQNLFLDAGFRSAYTRYLRLLNQGAMVLPEAGLVAFVLKANLNVWSVGAATPTAYSFGGTTPQAVNIYANNRQFWWCR